MKIPPPTPTIGSPDHAHPARQKPETQSKEKQIEERAKSTNHPTFRDLVGIRPRHYTKLVINPLLPESEWDWFCLDRVPYHGHELTVIWDRDGTKYHHARLPTPHQRPLRHPPTATFLSDRPRKLRTQTSRKLIYFRKKNGRSARKIAD